MARRAHHGREIMEHRMKVEILESLSGIIEEICDEDMGKLEPNQNLLIDLGIDSLDLLDITYEVDQRFGIKLPVDDWTEQVQLDKKKVAEYFNVGNLCICIEKLVQDRQGTQEDSL